VVRRGCQICRHPKRIEIEQHILERRLSMQSIAEEYDTTKTCVFAHSHYHMAPDAAGHSQHLVKADAMVRRLLKYSRETEKIFKQAKDIRDPEIALQAIQRIEAQIKLQAQLLGELKNASSVTLNILALPAWKQLQTILTTTLRNYPDALEAVVAALKAAIGSVPGLVPAPSRSLGAPTINVDGVETVVDVEAN